VSLIKNLLHYTLDYYVEAKQQVTSSQAAEGLGIHRLTHGTLPWRFPELGRNFNVRREG
jgi:hypothetical protein